MTEQVTVISVDGEGSPWEHGITYYPVTFDRNGTDFRCTWGKKGDPPSPGESVEGEFFQQNGEWRFRKASKPQGGGSFDYGSRSGGGGNFKGKSPDQEASIHRQVALKILAPTINKTGLTEIVKKVVVEIEDFINAASGASGGEGPAGPDASGSASMGAPSTAAASPQTPDDTHQHFSHLLEQAGLNPAAAALLANYCMESHQAKVQDCITALGGDKKQAVVDWLTERYEEAHGPLPGATQEEEIIF